LCIKLWKTWLKLIDYQLFTLDNLADIRNIIIHQNTTIMQLSVKTHLYQFSHSKSPRGNGTWAFNIGGEVILLPGMYSKAKKSALQMAAESGASLIKLLP
jgi:hypothetical protein